MLTVLQNIVLNCGTQIVMVRVNEADRFRDKNFRRKIMKNTITAITLAMVLTLSSTFAFAGILVGDAPTTTGTCTETKKDGILVSDAPGIIVLGNAAGIIVLGAQAVAGIIVLNPTPCPNGILVGD